VAEKFVTGDAKGWLNVRYSNDNSTYPPLPQYLRVEYSGTQAGRDSFLIQEGRPAGRHATVKRREDGSSYLADGSPWLPAGTIFFAVKSGALWYGVAGPVNVTTDPGNPQPYGTFDLEIPDEVHPLGEAYESQSIYSKSWFRVGHSGDRYLHTGSISAGCTTCTDIGSWTDIYNYLIRRRKGDGRSVGSMKVIRYSWERFVPEIVSRAISLVFRP
jgi:hypothetical protein